MFLRYVRCRRVLRGRSPVSVRGNPKLGAKTAFVIFRRQGECDPDTDTETPPLLLSRKGCGRARVHSEDDSGGRHAGHVPSSGGDCPSVPFRSNSTHVSSFFLARSSPGARASSRPPAFASPVDVSSPDDCSTDGIPRLMSAQEMYLSPRLLAAAGALARRARRSRTRTSPFARGASPRGGWPAAPPRRRSRSPPATARPRRARDRRPAHRPSPRVQRGGFDVCAAEPEAVAFVSPRLRADEKARGRRRREIYAV